MRLRSQGSHNLGTFDPEIERTVRTIRRIQRMDVDNRKVERQNDNRRREERPPPALTLNQRKRPVVPDTPSCIVLSNAARDYEVKNGYINGLPQFHGNSGENPLFFITGFDAFLQGIPRHGISDDDLKMRFFAYTLRGNAKAWFIEQTPRAYATWNAIRWRRYKALLRSCPHHRIPLDLQVDFFYQGISPQFQAIIDNRCDGYMGNRTEEELWEIIESITSNPTLRTGDNIASINEVALNNMFYRRMTELKSTMQSELQSALRAVLGNQGPSQVNQVGTLDGPITEIEDVNYMGSYGKPQRNNYSQNQRWGNSNWNAQGGSNNAPLLPPGFSRSYESRKEEPSSSSEDPIKLLTKQIAKFQSTIEQNQASTETAISNLHSQFTKFDMKLNQRMDTLEQYTKTSIHNLEVQMGSGKQLKEPEAWPQSISNKEEITPEGSTKTAPVLPEVHPDAYVPTIPYPQRLKKKENPEKYKKFMEMFTKLSINIPFAKAIAEIPSYAKFLKGVLSNKKKLGEFATVEGVHLPWFSDIINYLATGIEPPELSSYQKSKFFRDVKKYYWDDPYVTPQSV
ncbi:unnamed protein product [Cuscuta campestris]|uniref:Retrotransposon gag domain-containing protein n=1 Tax=Cuscuta campestris TaxID=132261 RepID=A0A484MDH1_9ASTE|nr:unnamed protein product [Cuscuta campestris]